MRGLNILILLWGACFSAYALAGEVCPKWMVRIEKQIGPQKVTGTGYLVMIGPDTFVRTAAHVTLGSPSGVTLFDCKGKPIPFFATDFISSNKDDDFLMRVDGQRNSVLGVFDQASGLFKLSKQSINEASRNKSRYNLEDLRDNNKNMTGASFYISPPWLAAEKLSYGTRRNSFDQLCNCQRRPSLVYSSSPQQFQLKDSPFSKQKGWREEAELKQSLVSNVLLVENYLVVPGESGSPFIKWKKAADAFSANASSKHYITRDGKTYGVTVNAQGQNVYQESEALLFPYIGGHILGYHRSFAQSLLLSFDGTDADSNLANLYLEGRRGDQGQTVWKLKGGNFYRIMKIGNRQVEEAVYINRPSGNGSGGSGGNGSGGSGGNGSGGSGGNGSGGSGGNGPGGSGGNVNEEALSRLFKQGLLINGRQVLSLKLLPQSPSILAQLPKALAQLFRMNASVTANWNNYLYLSELEEKLSSELFSEVSGSQMLREHLLQKSPKNLSEYDARHRYACLISRQSLDKGTFEMEINHYANGIINVKVPLEQIYPLYFHAKIPANRDLAGTVIDFSGLWGVDLSHLDGDREIRNAANSVYIAIKYPGGEYVEQSCAIIDKVIKGEQ